MVYKQVSYGDKDTFELAFALAEKHADFYRILQWPRAALGNITEVRTAPPCGVSNNLAFQLTVSASLVQNLSGLAKPAPRLSLFP